LTQPEKKKQGWHTLRNPNSIFSVSSDGEYIVVPVTVNPVKLTGFAVIRISDLAPQFGSLREAQEWAEKQIKESK
jgi:hypothetical protein